MAIRLVAFAWFVAFLPQDPQSQDPKSEYESKVRSLFKDLSRRYMEVGSYLTTQKQHQWAQTEYRNVVEFDPDNADAHKKLGESKNAAGAWARDFSLAIESANKVLDEYKAADIGLAYSKKLDALGTSIASKWVDAANYAVHHNLPADEAWRSVLRFDPNNAAARAALGFNAVPASDDLAWSKWRTAPVANLMNVMRASVAAAAVGDESKDAMDCEKKTGIDLAKRQTDHFRFGAPKLDQKRLGVLVQHAEATQSMFMQLLGLPASPIPGRVESVIYKDKSEHGKFVDAYVVDKRLNEFSKKCSGSIGRDFHEKYQGDGSDAVIDDHIVHSTTHSIVWFHTHHDAAWLTEGMAALMSRAIRNSAENHCTSVGWTVDGPGEGFKDPRKWRSMIKERVFERTDPSIESVLSASTAELYADKTVKAWSLLEFMLNEHREEFVAFMNALGNAPADATGAATLQNVFHETPQQLEEHWRAWVRATYP